MQQTSVGMRSMPSRADGHGRQLFCASDIQIGGMEPSGMKPLTVACP